jgi:hypothetical protein
MSPKGTAENGVGNLDVKARSVVPSGLRDIVFVSIPSDESLGYFQMSLWDTRLRRPVASGNMAQPEASPPKTHGI